jgi:O-acetyl-ADP-ribose deacetylase (regulator of RNase III)
MRNLVGPTDIAVVVDDITSLDVDAIVNAANPRLMGGGGVDGAIHRAAGPRLLDACRQFPEVAPGVRCRPGEAVITPGFDLPSRFVVHTVGPVWSGGDADEESTLRACYRNSLRLAAESGAQSVAFPSISTGVFGYPPKLAARVAVSELRTALAKAAGVRRVLLCAFSDQDASHLRFALAGS